MPDWRDAIDGLRLAPTRQAVLVEELSQHLDDRYAELRAGGASEDAARRDALAELDDPDLVRELTGIERPDAAEPLTGIGLLALCSLVASYVPDVVPSPSIR